MKLKSQQEIDAAIKKSYGKVTEKRKLELVSTIKATRPERMDELDAIFSEHLSDDEKAFYLDIVEGSKGVKEAAPAAPAPSAPGKA